MKAVILVHGYNVANPETTVGKLREPFEELGYLVETLTYGFVPFTWQITRNNPAIAKRLADRVKRYQEQGYTVDVVGHSNGSAITHIATKEYDMSVNVCVAINPALTADLNPSSKSDLVQVWHNDGDVAVEFGRFLRWLNPFARKARPWGRQGNAGYQGDDKNVRNFDCSRDFTIKADGHSAVFKKPESDFYLKAIPFYCKTMKRGRHG